MVKRLFAVLCVLALVLSALAVTGTAATQDDTLKAGYADVDLNPYWSTYIGTRKPNTMKDGDIMPLPMAGYGNNTHRLSAPALFDDNGDGKISGPDGDGLHATTLAIQNGDQTVIIITVDVISFNNTITRLVREMIAEATGIPGTNVMINGTHTHGGVDLTASFNAEGEPFVSADKKTNYTAAECTAYLDHYKTYVAGKLTESARQAIADLSPATMEKGSIDAGVENGGKVMNSVRHQIQKYTESTGTVTYVRGSSFNNNVNGDDEYDTYYTNCYDKGDVTSWRDTHVSQSDDALHLLRFKVEGKDDILLVNWRGHPASSNKAYKNASGKKVNIYNNLYSDYIGSIRYSLESSGYRTTFILGASGNLGAYSAFPWESWVEDQAAAKGLPIAVEYGKIVATTAKALLSKTKNTSSGAPMQGIEAGPILTSQLKYRMQIKTPSALELAACKAYQEKAADIAAHDSFVYTDPTTGEKYVVASSYHANAAVNRDKAGYKPGQTRAIELNVITVGKELSFLALPYEASDRYSMDATLATANNYNDWDALAKVGSFGTPFVMTCANDHIGYIPNHLAYNYNMGAEHYGKYAQGSYESQTALAVDGEGEKLMAVYKDMLEQMQTRQAACQHCKKTVTWYPLNQSVLATNDDHIPTGHYYLVKDLVYTESQVSITEGSQVCLDLNGNTYSVAQPRNASRAFNMSGESQLNIFDTSKAQTGKLMGRGVLKETSSSFAGGTLNIGTGCTVNLYGGTLTQDHTEGYHASNSGVVRILGTFNMYGGSVTSGIASAGLGGNIFVTEQGVFNMYGGTVSDGQASTYGGNIYVGSLAKFNMYGGKITGGTAQTGGPSVCVEYSSQNKHSVQLSGTTAGTEPVKITFRGSVGNMLQINGAYTGKVEIKTSGSVFEGMNVAKCGDNVDIGGATITVVGMGELSPIVSGDYIKLAKRLGWMQIGGKWYYYYEANKAQTGWYQEDGDWHYFDQDGVMQTGWLELDGVRYYLDAEGHRASGTCLTGNTISVFDENGVWQKYITGWYTLGEKKYYAGEDGKLVTAWLELDGTWYYFNPRYEMVTGWLEYGPVWYYFNPDGSMLQGFLYYGKQWYFFNSIGRMHIGWTQYQGKWYYMDENGHRVTGTVTIDGKENLFDENGVWIKEVTRNGWVKENNKWYYYNNSKKTTGWLDLNGTWYYFKTSGEMVTGWLAYGPVWYYFNPNGDMRTGWLTYGGQHYYFDTAVTNYGRMVVNKWIKDAGKWYYFDGNGYRVTGSKTIGGKTYNFDENGVCLNP